MTQHKIEGTDFQKVKALHDHCQDVAERAEKMIKDAKKAYWEEIYKACGIKDEDQKKHWNLDSKYESSGIYFVSSAERKEGKPNSLREILGEKPAKKKTLSEIRKLFG